MKEETPKKQSYRLQVDGSFRNQLCFFCNSFKIKHLFLQMFQGELETLYN